VYLYVEMGRVRYVDGQNESFSPTLGWRCSGPRAWMPGAWGAAK